MRRGCERLPSALALCAAALLSLPAAASGGSTDLVVNGIEVTQGVQTTSNSIDLVARRSTTVRATVQNAGPDPIFGVTGKLRVFVDGTEVTPAGGVAPINAPFTAPPTPPMIPIRQVEDGTLNFELTAATVISQSTDVDVRVRATPVAGESNTVNNTLQVDNLDAIKRRTPQIFFTRINYTPAGAGLPSLATVQPGRGDAFLRGVFPVNDGDPDLYQQGLFPTLPFAGDTNGNNLIDQPEAPSGTLTKEGSKLLDLLASCRQLIVDNGLGATDNTFLFGWLQGQPMNGFRGLGRTNGFVAFGGTNANVYQRTFAHEVGHNFGLAHPDEPGGNPEELDQVGWDTGARLRNNPATNEIDSVRRRVKFPPVVIEPTYDMMRGAQFTRNAWINTQSYLDLLGDPTLAPAGSTPDEADKNVMVIEGVVAPTEQEPFELNPVFRFPWRSVPGEGERDGRYLAVATARDGTRIEKPFDAVIEDDCTEDEACEPTLGQFEVMLPAPPGIVSLEIVDTESDEVVAALERSDAPPKVRIVAPKRGERLGRTTKLDWRGIDPDSRGLAYMVAYSPDGGDDFVPLGVDLTESELTFDSTQIERSRRGVLRVFASDGLNTAWADVKGLRVAAGKF
jgi:hypothetical protein